MHFNFYISQNDEKAKIVEIFQMDDPYGISARAKQYHISEELAKEIHENKSDKWNNELDNILSKTYKENEDKLKNSLKFFNDYWLKNDAYFFDKIEKVLSENVEQYNVLLSHFVAGTSDWVGNNICTNAYSNEWSGENSHIYYLLYETILSHIFKRIRKINEVLKDLKVWSISELTAFTILHNEFDLFESESKTNYDEIDNKREQVKEIYLKCKNMNDFLNIVLSLNDMV